MIREKIMKVLKNNYKEMPEIVIVSRHNATIEWIKQIFPEAKLHNGNLEHNQYDKNKVFLIGNIPMQLACEYNIVGIVEFDQFPPRGQELTANDLEKYGVKINVYSVKKYNL